MATAKRKKTRSKKKVATASAIKPLMDEVKSLSGRVAHVEAFLSKLNAT